LNQQKSAVFKALYYTISASWIWLAFL